MNLHYKEKLIDIRRCFAEGTYSAEAFRQPEYLERLAAYSDTKNCRADLARVLELVRPAPGLRVLDYGCGLGALCAELAAAGCVATGADAIPQMLAAAKERYPHVRFVGINDLQGEYDVVASVHVLGHVPDARRAIAGIYSLLSSGGRFVFCLPNPAFTMAMIPNNLANTYLPDPTAIRCWSARRLRRELASAGFVDIHIEPFGELPALFPFQPLRSRFVGQAAKC